ncbi:hypothetical protein ACFU96_46220 [Streptomyces sp. NPDC057620]|uniref:hypothetical protein n=1 Tax=Streptomyces sp. NPDC057620 TaxID=3346185 RepID=UPI0036C84793
MATRDLGRLGKAVKARRVKLFTSRLSAARAAGISKDTWKRVEDGLPVQPGTYSKMEPALKWAFESCEAVTEGGEPLLVEYVTTDGDVTMVSKPQVVSAGEVKDAVKISAFATMPDATIGSVQAQADRLVEELRKLGFPIEGD